MDFFLTSSSSSDVKVYIPPKCPSLSRTSQTLCSLYNSNPSKSHRSTLLIHIEVDVTESQPPCLNLNRSIDGVIAGSPSLIPVITHFEH